MEITALMNYSVLRCSNFLIYNPQSTNKELGCVAGPHTTLLHSTLENQNIMLETRSTKNQIRHHSETPILTLINYDYYYDYSAIASF